MARILQAVLLAGSHFVSVTCSTPFVTSPGPACEAGDATAQKQQPHDGLKACSSDIGDGSAMVQLQPFPIIKTSAVKASRSLPHYDRLGNFILDGPCDLGKLKGIGYLGSGYDVISGNPNPVMGKRVNIDTGFRAPVADMQNYSEERESSDGCHLLPNSVSDASMAVSCSYDIGFQEFQGGKTYQENLAIDAAVDLSKFGFSFTASGDFQHTYDSSRSAHMVFTETQAVCSSYQAWLIYGPHTPTPLRPDFMDSVIGLPNDADPGAADNEYYQLIKHYGTHIVTHVLMGARYGQRLAYSQKGQAEQDTLHVDVEAKAKIAFAINVGIGGQYDKKQQQQFNATIQDESVYAVGSVPPPDGRRDTWQQSAGDHPFPTQYRLVEISSFLTNKNFPTIGDDLEKKRRLLESHVLKYCQRIKGCIEHVDRLPTFDYVQVQSQFKGRVDLQCGDDQVALSCGLQKVSTDHPSTYKAGAYHLNYCSCDLGNSIGVCHAICVNKALVVAQNPQSAIGTGTVTCDPGFKVTGCGISEHTPSFIEPFGQDGKYGCRCSEGEWCLANCAKNVGSHWIKSTYGAGGVSVSRPDGTVVLGCGYKPDDESEQRPEWRPENATACFCHSEKGATCYSICGLLVAEQ